MTPAFASWSEFFAMGGYGFYVWLAASIAIISLFGLVIHTCWRRQQLLTEVSRRQERLLRIEKANAEKGNNNETSQ